jgi:hypothetical protein
MHLHVNTVENLRKKRYLLVNENNVAFDEANSHEVERETKLLMERADTIVENNGSIED